MCLQGSLSVERMCQLAQVSRASFYRSLQQQEPDREEMELRATIQQIFLDISDATVIVELAKNCSAGAW